MELAGGVIAGRNVDGASAGLAARVDGSLDGGAGVVLLVARGAEIFDVKDVLACGIGLRGGG